MKKKILSMLLSMVLTVACFTGCGSNPSSGGETGGTASTEIPKNPEDMYTVISAAVTTYVIRCGKTGFGPHNV